MNKSLWFLIRIIVIYNNKDFIVEKNNVFLSEKTEYDEIIENLKKEYKKKIEERITETKKEVANEFAVILGSEFSFLLKERKGFVENFGNSARDILNFALKNGLEKDVKELSRWSERTKTENEKIGEGGQLFSILVDKVSLLNTNLANAFRRSEENLSINRKSLEEIVKVKKGLLDRAQKKHKEALQLSILDVVAEFNKKIQVINKTFGMDFKQTISSFEDVDGDVNIRIEEDFEENLFIPSLNDGVIN